MKNEKTTYKISGYICCFALILLPQNSGEKTMTKSINDDVRDCRGYDRE
jgi:hypothetical protein